MGKFIQIPASAIEALCATIDTGIRRSGGSTVWKVEGHERVFEVTLSYRGPFERKFRIYSSITQGGRVCRAVGKDAVRILIGTTAANPRTERVGWFTLKKTPKILRTAPEGMDANRRVEHFIQRLELRAREAYVLARDIPACRRCRAPMAVRKAKGQTGTFLGCSTFPKCKGTR